jgi:polyisoprenoid-binding protein YceI
MICSSIEVMTSIIIRLPHCVASKIKKLYSMKNYTKSMALVVALGITGLANTTHAAKFTVDKEKSTVFVDVKATGDNFTGTLNNYTAAIEGDASAMKPSKVSFEWDFLSLKTGKDKRDAKMLDWLNKKTTGEFVLSSFTKRVDGAMWAKGTMTIHGVSKELEFPAKVISKGNQMSIRGTATIDTRLYELPIIKMLGLFTVDPIVKVRFSLRGTVK